MRIDAFYHPCQRFGFLTTFVDVSCPSTYDPNHLFLMPPLVFVDSGRGSSVWSKQSSQGIDEVAPTQGRADEASLNKRKFREISTQPPAANEDEAEPDLDLEVLTERELELELELESESESESESELELELGSESTQKNKRFCAGVQPPPFVYPKSQYEGHNYSLPKEKEWLVVKELLVCRMCNRICNCY